MSEMSYSCWGSVGSSSGNYEKSSLAHHDYLETWPKSCVPGVASPEVVVIVVVNLEVMMEVVAGVKGRDSIYPQSHSITQLPT